MAENLALERHRNNRRVQRTLVQLTVVGQVGVTGSPVLNPVEPVFRNTLGPARDLHPAMAGNLAMEERVKSVGVIHIHALWMVAGVLGAFGLPVTNSVVVA